MRILMLNYEFPPLGGGAAQATEELLRALNAFKHVHIDLVTSSPNVQKIEQLSDTVTVHRLNIGKHGKSPQEQDLRQVGQYAYRALRYCQELQRKRDFDLCHAHFGIPCGWVATRLHLPFIVTLRGSDVPGHNKKYRLLETLLLKKMSKRIWTQADEVVAVSHSLALLAQSTLSSCAIRVIPNGVDTDAFQPQSKNPSAPPTLLFVGRLAKIKGADLLPAIAAFLRDKCIPLQMRIVGDGPLRKNLENAIRTKQLDGFVELCGSVAHDQLSSLYHQADVLLLPSRNEGMPNVVLEAMACGLPIVCTNTGASELIDGNGIVVPIDDIQAIQEALAHLIRHPDERRKMANKSRELAKNYSWSTVAKEYIRLYEKVSEQHRDYSAK